ncbi:hypothetical protein [Roseomonas xinghualingensis]|uniref:hypothetical protein n=1 Tax=Roseomonas xinghualingensis TaxID=2986475 RepID=UPI0021F0C7BA|nr:hypothetical protein [Roseomonas sp. SXEYE001]MCV4210416.1 hypothetical protein [Roseomonas sp. SXEYE001]
MEIEMRERSHSAPGWQTLPSKAMPEPPRHGVISAISELADHARAHDLHRVDELLTELLAVLHAEQED